MYYEHVGNSFPQAWRHSKGILKLVNGGWIYPTSHEFDTLNHKIKVLAQIGGWAMFRKVWQKEEFRGNAVAHTALQLTKKIDTKDAPWTVLRNGYLWFFFINICILIHHQSSPMTRKWKITCETCVACLYSLLQPSRPFMTWPWSCNSPFKFHPLSPLAICWISSSSFIWNSLRSRRSENGVQFWPLSWPDMWPFKKISWLI